MIAHTREGCKCKGDGVHGAPSDAPEESAASARSSKRQKTVKTKAGSKLKGDESMLDIQHAYDFDPYVTT